MYLRPSRLGWIVLLLVWQVGSGAAQELGLSNLRRRWVHVQDFGSQLDTLLVVPSSLRVLQPKWAVDRVRVELDSLGQLQRMAGVLPDSLLIQYRVLPVLYRQRFPLGMLESMGRTPYRATDGGVGRGLFEDAWSRGVSPFTLKGYVVREAALTQQADAPSVGNMDLTLEGDLGRGFRVRGELLSQNLPFQPDGTSVEVRALDRIYLQVASSRWELEAGDVEVSSRGAFLLYNRALQGLQYTYRGSGLGESLDTLSLQLAAGMAKGVYTRVQVQPIEGVQGPYRLAGHRGFAQSVVLAGSERVYLNGELLGRGTDRDYVMDYNLGEVRFTVRRPIRRRDRIVVEYQVLERHFSRFSTMGQLHAQWSNGWDLSARAYVEHDVVASMQGVTDRDRAMEELSKLDSAGGSAWVYPSWPSIDGSVAGGYTLQDTLVEGHRYTYFAYVTRGEADSLYDVPFTYVGAGHGEYALTQGAANVPIYRWVGPSGTPQGEYRAGQRVRPPSSHRVAELDFGRQWRGGQGETRMSVAYSQMQENSLRRSGERDGVALSFSHKEVLLAQGGHTLEGGVDGRYTSEAFRPADAFLFTEYYRNWGMQERKALGEWLEGSVWIRARDRYGATHLRVEGIRLAQSLGWRATLDERHAGRSLGSKHRMSYVQMRQGESLHRALAGEVEWTLPRGAWRYSAFGDGEWVLGGGNWQLPRIHLYPYWRSGFRVASADSAHYELRAETAFRTEYPADTLRRASRARSIESSLQGSVRMPYRGELRLLASWRYGFGDASQHMLASVSYRQSAWGDRLLLLLEEEVSAEQTAAWQQHFVRVPYGQGTYVWVDADGDGVAQVEEFAHAQFKDQANYILQVVPSSVGAVALHHRLQGTVRYSPRSHQAPIDSGTAWWQRWDAELSTTSQRKRSDRLYRELFLPFYRQTGQGAVEWIDLLRAGLTLNREAFPFSVAYAFQRSLSSSLFSQGRDGRSSWSHAVTVGSPSEYTAQGSLRGEFAEVFASFPFRGGGQVRIRRYGLEGALQWRRNASWQHEWVAGVRRLLVSDSPRPAFMQDYAYTLRGALGRHWHGAVSLRYVRLHSFRGGYSSLLYEATQGMWEGNNAVLDLEVRWQISRYIELGGEYSLRSLSLTRPEHAASVHVRANFQ